MAINTSARNTFFWPFDSAVVMVLSVAMLIWAQTGQAQTTAIVGARIYPVSSPVLENGTIIVKAGRIAAIGIDVPIPQEATIVDAKGKWITPGFFDSMTGLGLTEIADDPESSDNQITSPNGVAASFRAIDSVNPDSVHWSEARDEGVTTVMTGALDQALVSGQAVLLKTSGSSRETMTRKAPVAMLFDLDQRTGALQSRGEVFARLREILDDALDFKLHKAEYAKGTTRTYTLAHADLEALQPVITGKLLAVFKVNRADDISAIVKLSLKYRLKTMIFDGHEAWKIAPELAAAKIPVITENGMELPTFMSMLGARPDNAAILKKAGVPVLFYTFGQPIGYGKDFFNVRNIRQQAGLAVSYGMPWGDALRALTLTPAETFGVASSIGSLEVGKNADLVVWDGDPFEPTTLASEVYIDGKPSKEQTRQDELTLKYKALVLGDKSRPEIPR